MKPGDGAPGIKRDGDLVGRDRIGKLGDRQDVVGVFGEECIDQGAAEGLNGTADSAERIDRVMQQGVSCGTGETDLVRESGHGDAFWEKGVSGQCEREVCGCQGESR